MLFPVQTMEYKLVAVGEREMTATEKIPVKVRAR